MLKIVMRPIFLEDKWKTAMREPKEEEKRGCEVERKALEVMIQCRPFPLSTIGRILRLVLDNNSEKKQETLGVLVACPQQR